MLTPESIKAYATGLGFDLCGIAPAGGFPELALLREWIEHGYHGEMAYMSRTAGLRADARHVLPTARSVIVTGTLYHVDRPFSTEVADAGIAQISRYAWGDDYHSVIEDRLDRLLAWMREQGGPFEARRYVDTGPIQEKVYAQHAGLGWVGKNTCLINPKVGSWLFLGEIICSLPLEPDPPGLEMCGSCTLCLDACPTQALLSPGVLDSTRCLSYLTIELKGPLPAETREAIGSHVYGCDICQDVCPWNGTTPTSSEPHWLPRAALDGPRLEELWRRSDGDLRGIMKGSAMMRAGVKRLRRNLAVALGNSGDTSALASLHETENSDAQALARDPLVADHVAWAQRKLEQR